MLSGTARAMPLQFSGLKSYPQHNLARAAEIVKSTGDRAAAYYLARQYEGRGDIQDALLFYGMSGCVAPGIKLAAANRLYSELMNFALKSTPTQMVRIRSCVLYWLRSYLRTSLRQPRITKLRDRLTKPCSCIKEQEILHVRFSCELLKIQTLGQWQAISSLDY